MLDPTAVEELAVSHHLDHAAHPRDNSYVRVSGIGSCRRQIAYRIEGYRQGVPEPPIWTHGLTIFELGHGLHLKLQERLSNVGPLKWVDAEPMIDAHGRFAWRGNAEIDLVDHEYRVAGHCDGLSRPLVRYTRNIDGQEIEFLEPTEESDPQGRRYIIDIKTITARDRLDIKRDPDTDMVRDWAVKPSAFEKLAAPKPEHIQQVALYSWLTTRPGFQTDRIAGPLQQLPGLMIIYVAKDLPPDYYARYPNDFPDPRGLLNSPFKVFTMDTDPRTVAAIQRRLKGIWTQIDQGTLPARDYHHTPERPAWACVDCPFRARCYESEGFFADALPVLPPRLVQRLEDVKEVAGRLI